MANDKGKIEPGKAYMEIVYRPLADLHPNPKNPRKSTKEDIEKLEKSIKGNRNNIRWDTYPEDSPFTNEPKRNFNLNR